MLRADLQPTKHLVGATNDLAFTFVAAVFATEALVYSAGGAARLRARLPYLPITVSDAMDESCLCGRGTSIKLAPSVRAMLAAKTPYLRKRLAPSNAALLSVVAAVFDAKAFRIGRGGATQPSANLLGGVPVAKTAADSACIATCSSAEPLCTVLPAKPLFFTGIAAAESRASRFDFWLVLGANATANRPCSAACSSAEPVRPVLHANTACFDSDVGAAWKRARHRMLGRVF